MKPDGMKEFRQLLEKAKSTPDKEKYFVRKAHILRLKKRTRLNEELKNAYCKKCYSIKGFTTRKRRQNIVTTCKNCGYARRKNISSSTR